MNNLWILREKLDCSRKSSLILEMARVELSVELSGGPVQGEPKLRESPSHGLGCGGSFKIPWASPTAI